MSDHPEKTEFETGTGVRHGSCECLFLYNLYMEFAMQVFKDGRSESNKNLRIHQKSIESQGYSYGNIQQILSDHQRK